ncbi:MAG: hypothetical protein BGO67_02130 [Alphaproteobacteria bacterium 41-28]|nr:MAG: hypothetical protein BGO67_02130 [Alphaproteobacteria bacterium 41-28]
MKEKYSCHNTLTKKQFFLLMIVPLLIGIIITFTSLAHAEWNKKDDPRLLQSPQRQGWVPVGERDLSSFLTKPQENLEKSLKTAER